VTREDAKQPFVGTIELDEPLRVETETAQRHPLVARLVDGVSGGKYGPRGATFHDVLSDADEQVVISMVNARDDLEWSYVDPENASADTNGRRLRITRRKIDGVSDPIPTTPDVEASATSECDNATSDDGGGTSKERENDGAAEGGASSSEDVTATAIGAEGRKDAQKKKARKAKTIKSVRFDRSSFPDTSMGSLVAGDVITCDIFLSRRSGTITVENISVVEIMDRTAVTAPDGEGGKENSTRRNLTGFVTEVVPSRQFGFITAVDENGFKTGEHAFFHFREVAFGPDEARDGGSQPAGRKKPTKVDVVIGKGEEVKFDVGPGKNGKLNATNIIVFPRGTLKFQSKADTSLSCTGYVLIEPSYTSLANAPSNVVSQSSGPAAGVGRWANVRDDKSATKSGFSVKEGVILLLSDPSRLFSPHPDTDHPKEMLVSDSEDKSVSNDSAPDENSPTDAENRDAPVKVEVGTHLGYKLSSMAARVFSTGSGASRGDGPKRGDLVSFSKTKGARMVKDIRIEKMGAATSVAGILVDVDKDNDSAIFVSSENDTKYKIKLTEVVSCEISLLKDKEQVDGILHEGKIFGGENYNWRT